MAYAGTLRRTIAWPERAAGRRPRLYRVAGVMAILVLLMVALMAARVTGGAPSPLNHLAYPPIILAAYLFGTRGALLSALVVSLFLGPLPWRIEADGPQWDPAVGWVRVAMYGLVALTTGLLFDRVRHAMSGWQTAAVTIAQRERDGMVALARGAEAKDTDTGDHVLRVQLVAERLAIATGMDLERAADVGWAAMLHDVGKLQVPDRILLKPGDLEPAEWRIMRQHTVWGEHILEHGSGFEMARAIARWHHENVDGSGYPDGLRGSAIPFEARIVRIADAFDAMTHDRPYRLGRSVPWAMAELQRCAGRQFDPELVRLFDDLLRSDPLLAERLLLSRKSETPPWRTPPPKGDRDPAAPAHS